MGELFDDLPASGAAALRSGPRGEARLRQAERRQVELRPVSLDELIGSDHLARLVWELVGRFDMRPLLDRVVAREGVAGHPQTDPAILVSLWLYATIEGVGSARELARLCVEHAAYRWLCGGVSLNHHTLSDFRVSHADWLDRELARGIAGLLGGRVISVETVAQDGLRVRASAGGSSFRRGPRLREFARLAQARVAQLKQRVAADPTPRRSRQQAAAERAARERAAKVEAALAALPAEEERKARNKSEAGKARVSVTDPEARVMKMPDGGFRPAYNVQFCAETEHGLLVGVAVTTSGADQDALVPMHRQVTTTVGRAVPNLLVDGGFVSRPGVEQVAAAGTAVHAPLGRLATETSGALRQWRERMGTAEAQARYRMRGQTIEWVNASVRNRGLYAVNVRGRAKVRAVALWHALAHNVSRILRTPELAAA